MSTSDPEEDQGANVSRCPDCGTARVVYRSKRDPIDRMSKAPSSIVAKWRGGKLYHCIFCRLQFYSTRPQARRSGKPDQNGEQPSSAA